jgi:hypothetical protein
MEILNWINAPLSPWDVLVYLNRIFNPPDLTTFSIESFVGSDLSTMKHYQTTGIDTSYAHEIHQNQIAQYEGGRFIDRPLVLSLTDLLNEWEIIATENPEEYYEGIYPIYIRKYHLVNTPVLFIYLQRIAGQIGGPLGQKIPITKVTTHVIPDPQIVIEKRTLTLISIVVHWGSVIGGHYVTYILCDGLWYFYNDLSYRQLSPIGTWEQLQKKNYWDEIVRNANCFFYV